MCLVFEYLPTEFRKIVLLHPHKKERFIVALLPSSPSPTFNESHWFFVAVLKSSQWSGLRVLSFHHFFQLFSIPLHPLPATPNTNPVGNTFFRKNHSCGDGEDFSTSKMKEILCCCWFELLYCAVH